MIKRMISLISASLLIVSLLAGCGNEKEPSQPSAEQAQPQQTEEAQPSTEQPQAQEGIFQTMQMTDFDGNEVDKSLFEGHRLTMVNIWATFCNPCLSEMPELGELAAEYAKEEGGVQIIGICTDITDLSGNTTQEAVDGAKRIVEMTGAAYPHLIPNDEFMAFLMQEVPGVPTTFFVDENGAIAALQEASGKGSRDSTRSSYVAYAQIVELCIELIRQFYGLPRSFRIAGRAGAEEYIRFSNAGLCPRPQPFGAALPVFDVKVSAQKRNAYSRLSQNELAMELYRMGIFDEGKEQEALSCLRMMEFDGRDELIGRITASMGLREKLDELQKYKALALAFARRYRPDMAEGLTGEPAAPLGAPSEAAAAPLGAPLRGAVASATEGSPELSPEQSEKDTDPTALAALLPPPHLP